MAIKARVIKYRRKYIENTSSRYEKVADKII